MKKTRLIALATATGFGTVSAGFIARRIQISRKLADQATPFTAQPESPGRKVLIVGDSTAVGTGASRPEDSVAGRIAAHNPTWQIDNQAENGAKFDGVVRQLEAVHKRYDAVLVLAGGNDVIRLTPSGKLRALTARAVALAQSHAPVVVLMPSGNVGHAPFFIPPLSWLMSRRSKMLHATIARVAQETGARYVRLLEPRARDAFALQSQTMHAEDGLHPSSKGYAHWYSELMRQGGLESTPV